MTIFLKKVSDKLEAWMIPLRSSLFFMFAANAAILPYIQLYLQQKGLDVSEIALFNVIAACSQFIALITSGMVADKVKNTKLIPLASLSLCVIMLNGLLFIPNAAFSPCNKHISLTKYINCYRLAEPFLNLTEKPHCLFNCFNEENLESQNTSRETVPCFNEISVFDLQEKTAFNDNTIKIPVVWKNNDTSRFIIEDFSKQKQPFLLCDYKSYMSNYNDTCLLSLPSLNNNMPCENLPDGKKLLFLILFLVCFVGYETMMLTSMRIMDVIIMSMVNTHGLDFGRERFWTMFSGVLFSVLSGYVVESTSEPGNAPNYDSAIYLFDACTIIALISLSFMKTEMEKPTEHLFKKSISFFINFDILIFFVVVLILGTCYNFMTFTNLYLDALGASSFLLALKPAAEKLYGLPFLIFSDFFINNVGSQNLIIVAFCGYVVYYICYAFLINPWWSLAIELTGVIIHHLLWVAVVRYSHSIAPLGLASTVIATSGALHFCIGLATGNLLGGLLISIFGGRPAYKIMAIISGVSGLLYALYLNINCYCTKWRTKNLSTLKGSTNEKQ